MFTVICSVLFETTPTKSKCCFEIILKFSVKEVVLSAYFVVIVSKSASIIIRYVTDFV